MRAVKVDVRNCFGNGVLEWVHAIAQMATMGKDK